MKSSLSNAPIRIMDNLKIFDLFKGEGFSFDFVIAELDGDHPAVRNHVSDKAYFILEGTGTAQISSIKETVNANDFIKIPRGEAHSISGKLRYVIICSPPFDPNNEEILDA